MRKMMSPMIGFLMLMGCAFSAVGIAWAETGMTAEMVPLANPDEVWVKVSLTGMNHLNMYGIETRFDPAEYQFVGSSRADGNRMSTNLLLVKSDPETKGTAWVARAIGDRITGEGGIDGDMPADILKFRKIGDGSGNGKLNFSLTIFSSGKMWALSPVFVKDQKPVMEFALNQNFPNPFNPVTEIAYQLPEATDVRLTIYNTLGQVVRTLVNERQAAGRYSARWDSIDDKGLAVASGTYFYRLASDKFNTVKKLMLIK